MPCRPRLQPSRVHSYLKPTPLRMEPYHRRLHNRKSQANGTVDPHARTAQPHPRETYPNKRPRVSKPKHPYPFNHPAVHATTSQLQFGLHQHRAAPNATAWPDTTLHCKRDSPAARVSTQMPIERGNLTFPNAACSDGPALRLWASGLASDPGDLSLRKRSASAYVIRDD